MSRFVDRTATLRYELENDDWVEFRKELSIGEKSAIKAAGLRSNIDRKTQDMNVQLDIAALEVATVAAWLYAWSFTDDDNKLVAPTRNAVGRLDEDSYNEIDALLVNHFEEMKVEQEGKATTTDPT